MSRRPTIKLAYTDDHVLVRKSIMEHIVDLGHYRFLIEADNGEELILKLHHAKVLPDICILDIYMPQMDGFASIRQLRRYWPSMKILVLTGIASEYSLIRMILAGANGYLGKDCGPEELDRALHSIFTNGIYYSESMPVEFFEDVKEGRRQMPVLSSAEEVFLNHACSDMSYTQIAEQMGRTAKQVEWLRNCLFRKFQVMSRPGLVMFAIQSGMVPVNAVLPVITLS